MKVAFIVNLLFCSALMFSQGKDIVIRSGQDHVTRIPVENLQKITFDSKTMQLHLASGEVAEIALGDIRFFSFESITGIQPSVANANWIVIPTHVKDQLTLKNLEEGPHLVAIFSSSGQLVHRQRIDNDYDTLYVEHLPAGIYLVRIGNRTMKFTKD